VRTPLPRAASVGISQDVIIFGFLALAFVIYITVMGELPTYLGFFIPPPTAGAGASATSGAPPTVTPSGIPGVPGLSTDPFAGLPTSWSNFFGGFGVHIPGGLPQVGLPSDGSTTVPYGGN